MNPMLHSYAWPALLMLAACQPAEQPSPGETSRAQAVRPAASPAPVSNGSAITSPAELIGEYRVAGVDGGDIDLPYGISAAIDDATIHVTADCVNLAWQYDFADGKLSTERAPVESCARGLNATEEALVAAFDSADAVRVTPSNGIEFSGGGHSVLLFSQ